MDNRDGFDQQLFDEFFGQQPQAIIWVKPVWNEKRDAIVDFEYTYCNEEGFHYLNIHKENIPGIRVSNSPTLNDELRAAFMKEMIAIYDTGKRSETRLFNKAINKFARVLRYKFRGGILSIVQDISQENKVIQTLEEEKKFSNSILDVTLNGIFVAKAMRNKNGEIEDFIFQRINPAFTQLSGFSEEQIIGRSFLRFFPMTKEAGVFDMHCRVCNTGQPESTEVYYEQGNITAWFYISSSQLNDGILVTFSDITEQKNTLQLIEQHRNLLENILEHSPVGISVTEAIRDDDGTIVNGRTIVANDISAAFTQIPKDIYLSKTINEIDPGIIHSPLYQQALHTLATGEPFQTQYFFQPSQRWLELSVAKMDDDHLINIFLDITNAKESQSRLERSLDDLKRSNENLEEFAYAASHDMKEPIRKVLIFIDILKQHLSDQLNEEDQVMLQKMEKATQRMKQLVEDLLLYSQVNREANLEENIDLDKKLNLVLEDLELLIKEKEAKVYADKLPVVKGHRRQIQQLFTNLIVNALKYSKPDVAPEIKIAYQLISGQETGLPLTPEELNKHYHFISIKDNGIGFNQADADKIFNVFTRLHHSTSRGTGVGLSIVRKVVENHHGYITAEGKPGVGATFNVYLPADG
jgi:PAS domain S-box-containing protein